MTANLQQLFDSALALHRAGDLEAAGRAYRDILASHPEQPDALNLLAMIDMEGDRPEAAAELLRRAIAVAGDRPQFPCSLGNALQGTGDFAAAADAYRKAVRLRPALPEDAVGELLAVQGEVGRLADPVFERKPGQRCPRPKSL